MSENPGDLTLEQQANLKILAVASKGWSREQTQERLIKLYEQMIVREVMYRDFLKREWGLM